MFIWHKLVIIYWMLLQPVTLFERLSRLGWYGKTMKTWVDGVFVFAPTHLGGQPLNVLDVGCATGVVSHYVAQKREHVIGIDLSHPMIKRAKQIAKTQSNSACFQQGNASAMAIDDHSMDLVFSASLVNIVPEADKVVADMVRVCKPGGYISLLVPLAGFTRADAKQVIKQLGLSGFAKVAFQTWHAGPPKMSQKSVSQLLTSQGLTVVDSTVYLGGLVMSVTACKSNK